MAARRDADEGIAAVEADLLRAGALRLVADEIVGSADYWRGPHAVDDIDVIGEMLGAWQLGDIEKLHAHYADDVDVVNGMWAAPVVGWPNYLISYQSQRARSQQVRLDRSNTLIRITPDGNSAWACYQWEFTAVVDGVPTSAFGHTTLVFEKRNGAWLIVHNHTSLVQASQVGTPAPAAQPPAATPPKS